MENNVKKNFSKIQKPGRRFLRVGGILGIIGVTLTALFAFLLGIPPFKQYILSLTGRQASALLSCTVTIGAITIDVRKGIVANNIVFSDPHNIRTLLRVERIAVRIDLKTLLKGRFRLRSIKITGLNGELFRSHRGLFAGPVDLGSVTPSVPGTMQKTELIPLVGIVSAERCTIAYIDTTAQIAAYEIVHSLSLEFIRTDSASFIMQAGTGRFLSSLWRGSVRSTNVKGAVGPTYLLFSKAQVLGDSVMLAFSGTIPFSEKKPWGLHGKAQVCSPHWNADAGFNASGAGFTRLPDILTVDIRGSTGTTAVCPLNATIRMAENKWALTAIMKPDWRIKGNGRYTTDGAINGSFHVQADTITADADIAGN
jgi:hypothetical protein